MRLLGQSLFLGDSQTDVLNTGTQRLVINVGIEVHEKYPVCIRCGLENTKCSNMGEEKCIISAMQLPTCSAGCPWEDPVSHLVAPRLLQHLSPALCHLPWHTWNRNSFLPSSSHPPHIALSSSQRVPGVLQHHIQHSLTIGTSSLTPFPPAFAVSKEGIPDSCQHHTDVLSFPRVHKECTQGVASGILYAEEGQDDRISCTILYISKFIRALLEEPQNNHQGRPGDTFVTCQYLPTYYLGRGLVVPALYQTFPRAERGNPAPSMLLKPNRICSSILLHYLLLRQKHCSPAAQHTVLAHNTACN